MPRGIYKRDKMTKNKTPKDKSPKIKIKKIDVSEDKSVSESLDWMGGLVEEMAGSTKLSEIRDNIQLLASLIVNNVVPSKVTKDLINNEIEANIQLLVYFRQKTVGLSSKEKGLNTARGGELIDEISTGNPVVRLVEVPPEPSL